LLAGVTVAGGPVDFSGVKGFDIAPGSSSAYAALDFSGITALYEINLTTGAATYLSIPAGFSVTSLAVRTQIPVAAGLNATPANLVLFRADTPGTTTTIPISGVTGGETLVGMDFRPATGQLMGLGINAAANTGTLYLIDPKSTGVSALATAIGAPGSIAFTTDGSTQIDLPDPAVVGYGFDFNPAVDRIRVVVGNGLSFRVNPITGAPLDGNAGITGVNPDGAINGATTGVTAAAYTNNFHTVTGGITTLYTLDDVTNSLFIQNPPNNGTQTNQKQITVNGSPLDFTGVNGFDITADGAMVAASSASSFGYGWAALTVGGTTRLYRIHLSDGKAVLQGQIGSGSTPLAGFTLACEPGDGFLPMTWPSVIGTNYRIETSENLVDWQPVPIIAKAAQAASTVSVPYSADTPKCFWRAVAP
jgi:hypothetical protein